LLITEYISAAKAGFLRVKLKSDYTQEAPTDEEHVFIGYSFVFTSAYYPTNELAYAVAYDTADSQNYLMRYNWNDPNKSPSLFPLKGLSADPNAAAYVGQAQLASVIYAENSDPNDFPVKGWIAGSTNTIWAYDDCVAPDFGITAPSYTSMFSFTGNKLAIVSKIDLDPESCNNENVNVIVVTNGGDGQGLSDHHKSMTLNNLNGNDEGHTGKTVTIADLSAASPNAGY